LKKIKTYFKGKGAVLCYHRVLPHKLVVNDCSPEKNLVISENCLENHLNFLKNNYKVVSMDKMHSHLLGDSCEFLIAITFDDGYKDNLHYALPLLEKYELPATISITTRFPEGDNWMWWYELEDLILNEKSLDINFRNLKLNASIKTKNLKSIAYSKIRKWIINEKEIIQKQFLTYLTKNKVRKNYSNITLNWEEILFLDSHKLINIGAHSHNHSNLKILDANEVLRDLSHCKILIEKYLKHPIKHFAYPYGTSNAISSSVINYLKNLNFKTAVTTSFGYVGINGNIYKIPRISFEHLSSVQDISLKISHYSSVLKANIKRFYT